MYNNTPIKQYGTCSVHLSFKGKTGVCKFYVVEHKTAIFAVNDSERLGLVKVNFDTVGHSVNWFMTLHLTHLENKSQNILNYSKALV